MMTDDRVTRDQASMDTAHVWSKRSLCVRAKVGAMVLDTHGRVIATGYNGPPARFKHFGLPCDQWCKRAGSSEEKCPGYSDCPSLHAEANALLHAGTDRLRGATVFVTTDVCFGCAKLIAGTEVIRVVVAKDGGDTLHRNPAKSYEFLADCGIEVFFL